MQEGRSHMFEEQVTEGHEKIVKAQDLFFRLMACEPGSEFKKTFAAAIQQNSLDEFYPVVVRAELSAALMLCHIAATQTTGFVFRDYLHECCGIKPAQFINMPLRDIADISEMPQTQIEHILHGFGFTLTEGIISDHPDAHRTAGSNDTARSGSIQKPRHAV